LRSQDQAENLARSVKAAVAATQVGVNQYKAGTVPFNTVFNLEITQVQQQDQLAIAHGNIALNLINVYRALGGGWELRLQKGNGCDVPALDVAQHGSLPPPTENLELQSR
jgi:outer membrane protein TolC